MYTVSNVKKIFTTKLLLFLEIKPDFAGRQQTDDTKIY